VDAGRPAGALRGLTATEARARLARLGRNALAPEPSGATLRLLMRQFGNPLVLVLLGAAVIAGLLQEFTDAAIVGAIPWSSVACWAS
jgi:Ca2+-transporting ATPase